MKVQFLSMLFIISISSSCLLAAQPKSSAVDSLEYIKKFSHVAPERSRQELIQSFHLGKELKLNKQVEWYTLGGTIGLKLNDLSLFKRSVSELGKLIDKNSSASEASTFLTLLGHYSLKSNYLSVAKQAYFCVFQKAKTDQNKLRASYRVSNSLLSEGNVTEAEKIMNQLLFIAEAKNLKAWLGGIKSTLGIYALHVKDYAKAKRLFKESMLAHQDFQNYSGEFNSGLNLLLSFALDSDNNFERIIDRVKGLANKNDDRDRLNLLRLIEILYEVKTIGLRSWHQEAATDILVKIESSTVRSAAKKFIWPELKLKVSEAKQQQAPNWITDKLVDFDCPVSEFYSKDIVESLLKMK
ncbi:hypothetical protein [Pseudoalteromonas sp. MTN2-4]|uniref:hypothetical protein n=1 Tax=Pseudoalteromonas sp. MTN2-4 TaxID=3056555 RepID=UPI0036F43665